VNSPSRLGAYKNETMEHTSSHFGSRRPSDEERAQAKYSSDSKEEGFLDILNE